MELLRRYSNSGDTVKSVQKLLRRVADRDQTDEPGVVSTGNGGRDVRSVRDRLGEERVRELVAARRAGVKLRELARRYGISESSVKRLLR